MSKIAKRWTVAAPITEDANIELKEFSSIFRQILFNRGIGTASAADSFLNSSNLDTTRSDLLGIPEAVSRIRTAIENNEQIIIFGDYDADGVTSTALLVITLRALNANVKEFLPDRVLDGYGLRNSKLEELKESGVKLVITVDCGIRAVEQAKFAQEIGLDLIITDHHTPGTQIPDAIAVINPKQSGDDYPDKDLAGVGVAYKLACALIKTYPDAKIKPEELLDLVAIGTVADLAPLLGENRTIVAQGIENIHRSTRQGIFSLLGIAGVQPVEVNSNKIGFTIGPRINAAGRIASAVDSFDLIISTDPKIAGALAQKLDNINKERQVETVNIHEKANELLGEDVEKDFIIFAADPAFNPGVVGLAASRLVEKYYRPAIVANQTETHTRGSCRSIPEFNITTALEECADLLEHFGGHAAAAGFTVKNENLDAFVQRLKKISKEKLDGIDLRPVVLADINVKLSDLTPSLIREITRLEPTGYGNSEPIFITRNLQIRGKRTVGKDKNHLKLTLSDGKVVFDAIAFRFGDMFEQLNNKIDIAYKFELNIFNGRRSLQLNIVDIIPH
jgi:single-stranded-DNA-specific exonuclease